MYIMPKFWCVIVIFQISKTFLLVLTFAFYCAGNFKRSPGYSASLQDKNQERAYPRKERRPFIGVKPRKQISDPDDDYAAEDNVKDPRLMQYEKW
jgi:hypothetical protein